MSEEPTTPAAKDKPVNPLVVGIMMALVALLAPLMFSFIFLDGLCFGVLAVLWSFTSTPWGTRLETSDTFTFAILMPFGLLRLAYACQMVRLYMARTTKKRTLALGIVSFPSRFFSYQFSSRCFCIRMVQWCCLGPHSFS